MYSFTILFCHYFIFVIIFLATCICMLVHNWGLIFWYRGFIVQRVVKMKLMIQKKDAEKSMQLLKHLNDCDYNTMSLKMASDCSDSYRRFFLEGSERCGSNFGRCNYLCPSASVPTISSTIAFDFILTWSCRWFNVKLNLYLTLLSWLVVILWLFSFNLFFNFFLFTIGKFLILI